MELKSFNLLIAGIGGQGVIRTILILAWAALLDNYKVRTAETHGMAQKGGSVSSFLRYIIVGYKKIIRLDYIVIVNPSFSSIFTASSIISSSTRTISIESSFTKVE